ncbi:hypothetical protein PG990_002010 [Apiospora arundinis]|jgi:hypothetical protein|uniref:Uncharacterized protein n=1 Tax=Apiospora arundinis TaxID=335852 RepID=A0ABR2I450_9PEZI
MQFSAVTALFGLLLAAGPAMAAPVEDESSLLNTRATCGARYGAPIAAFRVGASCSGSGYGCDTSCRSIVQCANGRFVTIATCASDNCAGNFNNGAVCR